jgi:hypothetical protein
MNIASAAPAAEATVASAPRKLGPIPFLIRLTLISVVVLLLAQAFSVRFVERLLPAFRAEIYALDNNISIASLDVVQDGPGMRVRMRANLWRPVYINRSVVYPLGSNGRPEGWYQVHLNTGGVLQASLLFLIVVLSWPHRSIGEFAVRLGLAIPFVAALLAVDAPLELLGNFHHLVLLDVDPHPLQPLFIWDKFLEGGGNCVLALALSALAISFAGAARAKMGTK